MEKVTQYKASDGKVFSTESEAAAYERIMDLDVAFESDDAFSYGVLSFYDAHDLMEFIERHKDAILKALEGK